MEMWDWMDHMGVWWWIGFPAMLVFVVLVAVGVWWLARESQRDRGSCRVEDVLFECFARGEITESQFRRRRELVRSLKPREGTPSGP